MKLVLLLLSMIFITSAQASIVFSDTFITTNTSSNYSRFGDDPTVWTWNSNGYLQSLQNSTSTSTHQGLVPTNIVVGDGTYYNISVWQSYSNSGYTGGILFDCASDGTTCYRSDLGAGNDAIRFFKLTNNFTTDTYIGNIGFSSSPNVFYNLTYNIYSNGTIYVFHNSTNLGSISSFVYSSTNKSVGLYYYGVGSPYTVHWKNLIVSDSINSSAGVPNITSWWNNNTNDNSVAVTIDATNVVQFNITASNYTSISWSVDGTDQNINNTIFNFSNTYPRIKSFNIIATATNTNGSATKTWGITNLIWNKNKLANPIIASSDVCGGIFGEGESLINLSGVYNVTDVIEIYFRCNSGASSTIYYGNTTTGVSFSNYTSLQLDGYAYPYAEDVVFNSSITKRFLFATKLSDNQIYIWEITNKTTLTSWNNGNPVLYTSVSGNGTGYANSATLYNTTSKKWNMIVESSGGGGFKLQYTNASVDLVNALNTTLINFTSNITGTVLNEINGVGGAGGGNPDLKVNNNDAVLYTGCSDTAWKICRWDISNDFSNFTESVANPEIIADKSYDGTHVTDPSYIILPDSMISTVGRGYKNWFSYTANQNSLAVAFSNITVGTSPTPPSTPVIGNITTGNFYVNTSYSGGSGYKTDTYKTSVNGIITNGVTTTFINSTLQSHDFQNLSIWGWNNSCSCLSSSALIVSTRVPNNIPSITSSLSSGSITQGGTETITANITDLDGDNLTVTAGITYIGSETNYTMNLSPNTTTYTYNFIPEAVGSYSVNIYIFDGYDNLSHSVGTFIVQASASGGGGGGGGGYVPSSTPMVAPLQSSFNLSTMPFIEGARSISDIEAINRCLIDSFFLSNQCTGVIVVVMKEQVNWLSLIMGAFFGAMGTLYGMTIFGKKKRSIILDSLIYATVTIIFILAMNLIGFNFTYILNYLMDSSLPVWLFFSSMMWSFLVSIVVDEWVMKKEYIWTTRKISL